MHPEKYSHHRKLLDGGANRPTRKKEFSTEFLLRMWKCGFPEYKSTVKH